MVRSFAAFLLHTANLRWWLGVVVLERRRLCPTHLHLDTFASRPPPVQDSPAGCCTLEQRRCIRVEEGSPALDLRRALLVGTATLGLRWRHAESLASARRPVSFLLK